MPKPISKEKIQLLKKLHSEGLTVAEISRQLGVSSGTVYNYTKLQQRGFETPAEYYNHLAQQRGLTSLTDSQLEAVRKRGFSSLTEYREHLAKLRGFTSKSEYEKSRLRNRGEYLGNQELADMLFLVKSETGWSYQFLSNILEISVNSIERYAHKNTSPSRRVESRLMKRLREIHLDYLESRG